MATKRLRQDEVACSDLGGEIVILDLRTSTYFAVRDSAAVLVESLMRGASTEDLVAGLLGRYEVAEDVARDDVLAFLADLDTRGLLETVDA